MQTDLKSELRFKRYCIFLSKSIKDSLHAAFWWVAGLSCGWLASPADQYYTVYWGKRSEFRTRKFKILSYYLQHYSNSADTIQIHSTIQNIMYYLNSEYE